MVVVTAEGVVEICAAEALVVVVTAAGPTGVAVSVGNEAVELGLAAKGEDGESEIEAASTVACVPLINRTSTLTGELFTDRLFSSLVGRDKLKEVPETAVEASSGIWNSSPFWIPARDGSPKTVTVPDWLANAGSEPCNVIAVGAAVAAPAG